MAKCNLGDGKSAYFGTDLWHSNCLHLIYPHLFSFARDTEISVHNAIQSEYLEDLFHLPLSVQAYEQFLQLEGICDELRASEFINCNDSSSYIWGSERFSSRQAYNIMIGVKIVPPHFQWIRKCSCQQKHKVFFWMMLHDRVNTRNLMRRKTFYLESYNCALMNCQQRTPFYTYSGDALLQSDVGIMFAQTEIILYLSGMHWRTWKPN